MASVPRYWFRAKRYGFGWGLPTAWQGWAVLLIYLGLTTLSVALMRSRMSPFEPASLGFLVLSLTAAFVLICWWKGEPARWRWGND